MSSAEGALQTVLALDLWRMSPEDDRHRVRPGAGITVALVLANRPTPKSHVQRALRNRSWAPRGWTARRSSPPRGRRPSAVELRPYSPARRGTGRSRAPGPQSVQRVATIGRRSKFVRLTPFAVCGIPWAPAVCACAKNHRMIALSRQSPSTTRTASASAGDSSCNCRYFPNRDCTRNSW